MGRKQIKSEDKKKKLSITIYSGNDKIMERYNINKSKLINWLLVEYFNQVKGYG